MGTVISKAANGIGVVAGNAFLVPIKAIFGKSCEGICSGTWDLICFLEHLCISSLVRLFMVAILTFIILLFFYLLFQVGIIQCIGRSLCKMTWAGCETYWTAFEEISCFLWHKLKNTKRVYRHRFEDMEEAFSSSDDYDSSEESVRITRRRRSLRDRRKDRIRRSLKRRRYASGSHHHVRLKTREVSVRVKGSGRISKSRSHRSHRSDQQRRRMRYK